MTKTFKIIAVTAVIAAAGAWFIMKKSKPIRSDVKTAAVVVGSIEHTVSTTGNVQPQNRLEIKSPISGRIDKILVKEGQTVKTGDLLVLLSSTERAALLDAARVQGAESLKDWEDAYKPTALIATIDGQVIVKAVNPGQTVTPADPVVVLSDRLIVQAQVDETDIGKVKAGQQALITMDAYPDLEVKGVVDHIYYESTIVNNVTIYKVDILPQELPPVFRSGMSANVSIIQDQKDNILIIPREAVKKKQGESFVMVEEEGEKKPQRTPITTGISDETNIEVVSGLSEGDRVVIGESKRPSSRASNQKTSPFMPGGGRGR